MSRVPPVTISAVLITGLGYASLHRDADAPILSSSLSRCVRCNRPCVGERNDLDKLRRKSMPVDEVPCHGGGTPGAQLPVSRKPVSHSRPPWHRVGRAFDADRTGTGRDSINATGPAA